MEQYIKKSALVAEIEKLKGQLLRGACSSQISMQTRCKEESYDEVLSFLDTLEVKENKLPNPRFPHLNNIVDKVWGAGNLESWEYEEAEQLVLLAKEELLKDLEVKEVDLEKELDAMITPELKFHKALPSLFDVAKHFFELGLKTQKGEEV